MIIKKNKEYKCERDRDRNRFEKEKSTLKKRQNKYINKSFFFSRPFMSRSRIF